MTIPLIPKSIISESIKFDKISPSKYTGLVKGCVYKELIFKSLYSNKEFILPFPIAAYTGTVAHKMFEYTVNGLINNSEDFLLLWNKEIEKLEADIIRNNSFSSLLLPLIDHEKFYKTLEAVSKIIATRKPLKHSKPSSSEVPQKQSPSEVKIDDVEFLTGSIDLVNEIEGGVEILDYKTGNIFENGQEIVEIKEDYVSQLKLYALMYQLSKKKKL